MGFNSGFKGLIKCKTWVPKGYVAEKEPNFLGPWNAVTDGIVQPLGPLAKLWKSTVSFVMSVCPHARPLDGFSWNFIFKYFSKICRDNWTFLKVWNESRIFYMKPYVHLWFLAQVSLIVRNFSDENCRGYQDTFYFRWPFLEYLAVYEMMWRNAAGPVRPQMTLEHGACALHIG